MYSFIWLKGLEAPVEDQVEFFECDEPSDDLYLHVSHHSNQPSHHTTDLVFVQLAIDLPS
jgi:hypothetical protein